MYTHLLNLYTIGDWNTTRFTYLWYIPGNRLIVDALRRSTSSISETSVVKQESEDVELVTSETSDKKPNMIVHQGALIDVASLMARLERADKTRAAIEDRYKKLKVELGMLNSTLKICLDDFII